MLKEKKITKIWKCEHCFSFYHLRERALNCAKKDLERANNRFPENSKKKYKPIVSLYKGEMFRVDKGG